MDFQPSDTEEAIRAGSEAMLREFFPLSAARSPAPGGWQRMADTGWFAITLPEAAGGVGLGLGAEALVFAEMGRFLAPVGAIAAAVGARMAWRAGDAALAGQIAGGALRPALALDAGAAGMRLLDADGAQAMVTVGARRARIDDAPDLDLVPCLDLTMRQAMLPRLNVAPRAQSDDGEAHAHLQLLAAAYALGCAECARDMAVEYAGTREQFGKPIGAFQALKHIMADMAVRCSAARAQLIHAALALDAQSANAAFQLAAAKRLADDAALSNGRANIQVHGGIGMTDEAGAHVPLKRAHLLGFIAPATAADLLAA